MFESYPEVLSIEDLMKMLRIGRNKAYELVNSGQIPPFLTKPHRILKSKVIAYAEKQADQLMKFD
ncbi:MAG: helix-turn-helix domain-containing protein [Clostridia bacterium]|nr:helix-turn-helix domain-containing protein [Clostridia bacterium]